MSASWARRCAALAAAALAIGLVAVPPAAAANRGFTTASGGRVALLPSGLRVYVENDGPHPRALYRKTRIAVAQVREAGLPVRFAGWGAPREGTHGTVSVRPLHCDGPGYVGDVRPRTLFTGWAEVRLSAVIAVCPAAFRSGAVLRATMLAQLARAVGLGTYNGTYEGHTQVLNGTVQPQYAGYQAGDRNGLRYLAAITREIAPTLRPTAGGLAAGGLTTGSIRVSGWALNGSEDDNPAQVTIRRDSEVLATVVANISSAAGHGRAGAKHMTTANDFAYVDPHPRPGTHRYCVRLLDRTSLTIKSVRLGCVSARPDMLSTGLTATSGPDGTGIVTLSGTAVLTGSPDTPLGVTVMAGGLRRGQGQVDPATHTFSVPAAALPGTYDYCVTVSGGGQTARAGCVQLTA